MSQQLPLQDRFSEFCRNYPRAEEIDAITLSAHEESRRLAGNLQRADDFFNGRSIIAEVKIPEVDPQPKVVQIMKQAGIGPGDLAKGAHSVEDLFKGVSNGKKLPASSMARPAGLLKFSPLATVVTVDLSVEENDIGIGRFADEICQLPRGVPVHLWNTAPIRRQLIRRWI